MSDVAIAEPAVRTAPFVKGPEQASRLDEFLSALNVGDDYTWAWTNYERTIRALSEHFDLKDVIEIGGGRNPTFAPDQYLERGGSYTINDIEQGELDAAPDGYEHLLFDVSAKDGPINEQAYDLAFSCMVFEHVRDGAQAWRNVHRMLKPGGVAVAFIPTLYALPYIANLALPEWVSQAIVKALFPNRTDEESPKFPAHYSHCFAMESKLSPVLRNAGFAEWRVVPFYGHDYFEKLPLVRSADNALSSLAKRRNWTALAAYAYIIARKSPE